MDLPSYLPEELLYCASIPTLEELYLRLIQGSEEHIVLFFEYAGEDETWTSLHIAFIHKLIKWFTKHAMEGKLSFEHSLRVAMTVQGHYEAMKAAMHYDVIFQIAGDNVPINSLLASVSSDFFKDLMRRECYERKKNIVTLGSVTLDVFILISDYLHTGSGSLLWKKSQDDLFELLNQARDWGLDDLSELCSFHLKRYLNKQNIIEMLARSHHDGLKEWRQQCIDFANSAYEGIVFFPCALDADLGVEIRHIDDKNMAILQSLQGDISYVKGIGRITDDIEFAKWLSSLSKLKGLDLSDTSIPTARLLEAIHKLRSLDLSYCHWLDDRVIAMLLSANEGLRELRLAGNSELTYAIWEKLSSLPQLAVLNLTQCKQIGDRELTLIGSAAPLLRELVLEGCSGITGEGIKAIVSLCQRLSHLNISFCQSITEQQWLTILPPANSLGILNIAYCEGLSDKVFSQLIVSCSGLQEVNVKGCDISPQTIDSLQKTFPNIKIVN